MNISLKIFGNVLFFENIAQKRVKIQVSLLETKINDPVCVVVWKWLCTAWSACNVTFLHYFGRCISCTVPVGYRDKVTSMTVLEIVPEIRVYT